MRADPQSVNHRSRSTAAVRTVVPEKWLDWAAYATWLVVSLPAIAAIVNGDLAGWKAVVWIAAFVTFGAAFTICVRTGSSAGDRRRVVPLLALESLAGFTMMAITDNGTAAATLVIVVAQAAAALPPWGAWAWLAMQTILIAVLWAVSDGWITAATVGGAFAGFQMFAIATMTLAHRERTARQELTRANAELLSTQSLLAESTRVAERLRISRDLHDALGHHLTALSLQLDVASRLTEGPAAKHVEQAHAIARLLLSDVRDVVGTMRQEGRVDLGSAIRTLAGNVQTLQIHLDMPETLALDDPEQAHALLRCVQELITNASRHGHARNLWIRIEPRADGIDLHARDDGQGAAELKLGHGLTGMRERFEQHSGRVEINPGAGRGFEVHGFLPRPETAS
jgi:signal transduction histidine kinase